MGQHNENLSTKSIHFKILITFPCNYHSPDDKTRQLGKHFFAKISWGSLGCQFSWVGVPGQEKFEAPDLAVQSLLLTSCGSLSGYNTIQLDKAGRSDQRALCVLSYQNVVAGMGPVQIL
jgi:hypothetical protein